MASVFYFSQACVLVRSYLRICQRMPEKHKSKLSIYPQVLIGSVLSSTLQKLYGVQFDLRMVRQNRKKKVGTLDFIDYAIPCFELARELNISPEVIAKRLAESVSSSKDESDVGQYIRDSYIEAVDGYLNFQLSDNYLAKLISQAAQWFSLPQLITASVRPQAMLVIGPTISETVQPYDTMYQALFCADAMYKLLGKEVPKYCLLRDYSEDTLDILTGLLEAIDNSKLPGVYPNSRTFEFTRQTKSFMTKSGENPENEKVTKLYGEKRNDWLKLHKKSLSFLDQPENRVLFESSLAYQVNGFIDELSDNRLKGIIHDAETGAVYYITPGNEALALRSAGGLLYSFAYLLFALEAILGVIEEKRNGEVLIIVPQKLHPIIYQYFAMLKEYKSLSSTIICFDPAVSQADIVEINRSIPRLMEHFTNLSTVLKDVMASDLDHYKARQNVLSLIDLPSELSSYIAGGNLAALFDALNHSALAANELSR